MLAASEDEERPSFQLAELVSDELRARIREQLDAIVRLIETPLTVPDTGEFHPVTVAFDNPDESLYAGRIQFLLRSGFEDEVTRFFDVRVATPSGKGGASVGYLLVGDNRAVLQGLRRYINEPDKDGETIRQAAGLLEESAKA